MPGSISLKAVSYKTPDGVTLFSDLDLSFGPVRTGLIGRNGTGKTTLLKLVMGELAPSSGEVVASGTLGILRQTVQRSEASVAEALGCAEALALLDRLEAGAPDDLRPRDRRRPPALAARGGGGGARHPARPASGGRGRGGVSAGARMRARARGPRRAGQHTG